jgi:hypothetical protein
MEGVCLSIRVLRLLHGHFHIQSALVSCLVDGGAGGSGGSVGGGNIDKE